MKYLVTGLIVALTIVLTGSAVAKDEVIVVADNDVDIAISHTIGQEKGWRVIKIESESYLYQVLMHVGAECVVAVGRNAEDYVTPTEGKSIGTALQGETRYHTNDVVLDAALDPGFECGL